MSVREQFILSGQLTGQVVYVQGRRLQIDGVKDDAKNKLKERSSVKNYYEIMNEIMEDLD